MPKISDKLSNEEKRKYIKSLIKVGSVFKLYVTDTTPPKQKRVALLGIDKKYISIAIFYINTEIAIYNLQQGLKSLQMELKSDKNNYLTHDSFLDCAGIHSKNISDLINYLEDGNLDAYLGEMKIDDVKKARLLASRSRTIPFKTKNKFNLI